MEHASGGSDISAEFECVICTLSSREPVRPSCCDHVFCRSCLTQSLSIRQHCPLCRTPASEHVVPADDVLRRVRANAVAALARQNEIMNEDLRNGWTLPALGQFSTAPSPGIRDRLHRLRASMEASGQSALPPPAPGVPAALGRSPAAPTRLSRHALITGVAWTSILSDAPTHALQPGPLGPPEPPALSSSVLYSSSSDEDLTNDILSEYVMGPLTPDWSLGLEVSCPYCQQGALSELDLLEHCSTSHRADTRSVVCPICVALPHGNPTYQSRNFIRHLTLGHRYYNGDFVEASRMDAINEQAAILGSWNTLAQRHKCVSAELSVLSHLLKP